MLVRVYAATARTPAPHAQVALVFTFEPPAASGGFPGDEPGLTVRPWSAVGGVEVDRRCWVVPGACRLVVSGFPDPLSPQDLLRLALANEPGFVLVAGERLAALEGE